MGQGIGTIVGLITAFAVTFIFLMLGDFMPSDVISPVIVTDFLSHPDFEIKLAVVGTVMYPGVAELLPYGAESATVLMALSWGIGGLVAGLLARDFVKGVFAALFAVIIGAFLTWLLLFFVQSTDYAQIFGSLSLMLMENTLLGALYPGIAAIIGGVLGGGITRRR
ncbi:MAG: hypothetical protein RTU92_10515 [Candidatus Thorarchaeota archaeon]